MEFRGNATPTPGDARDFGRGTHAWFALHRIKFQRPQKGQPVYSYCPECSANRPVSIRDPELIERSNLT